MRMIFAVGLVTMTVAAATAYAQSATSGSATQPPVAPAGPGPHLREDVRQHDFAEGKQLVLHRLAQRISIATAAQACVTAANTPEQVKACLQQEHAAMMQARSEGEH